MEEMHVSNTTGYRVGESLAGAVRMLLAAELLLYALLRILNSAFVRWRLSEASFWNIQCMLVLAVVLFGIAAPACGKFRMVVYALLEIGLLSLGGWYTWKHFDRLKDGLFGLCDDYLEAWNAYYKTNYLVGGSWLQTGWTLGFLILVFILLCLLLRYVTGVRFLMLVPPLGALALDLLVDRLPDWNGLAALLIGTVVLYSGPSESPKLMFIPVKQRGKRGRQLGLQIGSLMLAAVLAFGVVTVAGSLFAEPAARIPEKTPEFMAFQRKLESDIESLGNGIHFSSNKESVDNMTPEYRDELILTISASQKPETNLYLPEFYSGSYRNGQWVKENRDYRHAAARSGSEADRIGTLVRQMGYENLGVIMNDPWQVVNMQISEQAQCHYTIEYGKQRSASAWLPYFADLTSLEGAAWVEDEGLTKKRWSTDKLSFDGWEYNTELTRFISYMSMLEDEDNEKDAIDWYSGYVQEHYQNGCALEAVQQAADEQRGRWRELRSGVVAYSYQPENSTDMRVWVMDDLLDVPGVGDGYYKSEDSIKTNLYRLIMANLVSMQLAELCEYNLYLDDIPSGTDTIQYFLETGHEGYCMHFASAGALVLQELGIPARYASGYIVKQNAFSRQKGGGYSAEVFDRNAHAWTEIYLEDIGWIPIEMTPGYKTVESSLPTDANRQDELMEQHENKNEEQEDSEEFVPDKDLNRPDETENSETEEALEEAPQMPESQDAGIFGGGGKGTGISWILIARWIGIAAALAALLALCVWLVRLGIRRYHEALWEEMRKKQNRRAVRRINRRIYRRLQGGIGMLGLQWVGITDAEYERKLVRAYPSVPPQDWAEYMRIVKKAAFSMEAIEEAELELCYQIYKAHRNKTHK